MTKPKQRKGGSKSQATKLEHDVKYFLGAQSRTTGYRAATYTPTLEQFQSISFSDFVRGVLMGAPLDNVENIEPYFPGDSDEESTTSEKEEEQVGHDCNDDTDSATTGSSKAVHEQENAQESTDENAEAKDETSDDALNTIITTNTMSTPEKDEETTSRRMTTRSRSGASKYLNLPPEKENIYSKTYYTSPSSSSKRGRGDESDDKMTKQEKQKPLIRPPSLEPDSLKLSDGIAKITPPVGWWDKAGIDKDITARGAPWAEGTKLGDMKIPSPISQCIAGIGGVYDFTMMELPTVSVAEFRERADKYRKMQVGNELDDDESDEHMDDLARKFWKRLGPTMQSSQYGADMEGTLFDGAEACGWNVDQLESCLALLEADCKDSSDISERFKLPGVTSAYLYFGMWASVFSAHTEDMNLLSINYLHAGAPKYWYAIAEEDADRFESLMKSMFSHQANDCKEFLRHKRSLMSPNLLKKHGISFTTQVQRAGDIIITFPGSYHFGFNTGFNCAESTNFAVPEWVPFGKEANICMCHPHSVRIDMTRFEELLDQYEKEVFAMKGPKPTYTEWVKNYIMRKKRRKRGKNSKAEAVESKKGKAKSFEVEVMKLATYRTKTGKGKPAGKKAKGKSKKAAEKEEKRHTALPMRVVHMKPQTRVICLLDTDDDEECYFTGVVVDVVEDHAKIHFAGTTKSEDIWLTLDSGKLFLDGGEK